MDSMVSFYSLLNMKVIWLYIVCGDKIYSYIYGRVNLYEWR